jgi:hypothetical protein
MKDAHVAETDAFSDEMQVDFDMLRALVLYRVSGEVHHADVVAVDDRGLTRWAAKLAKQLAEPPRLGDDVGDDSVLRFGAGAGHRGLPFG